MNRYIPQKEKIIRFLLDKQDGKCANNPFHKAIGLNGYDCLMWKCYGGKFDESGHELDHIIELSCIEKDGLEKYGLKSFHDIENFQILCSPCHKAKTKRFMKDKTLNSFDRHYDYTPMTDEDNVKKKKRKS